MLWNLDTGWLMLIVAIVGIFSFILAMGMHAIMGDDGFGPIGNMVIIACGFFLAIFVANQWGIRLADLKLAAATGLGGAFVCLATLAVAKAALNRL